MKKKIAIITPTIYAIGGESRVVTVVANELCEKYDVTIYTCEKQANKNIYYLNKDINVVSYYPYSMLPVASVIRFMYRKTKLSFFEKHIKLLDYAYYSNNAVKKMKRLVEHSADIVIAVSGNLTILLGKCLIDNLITIGWEHSSYEAYFTTPHRYLWKKEEIFKSAVRGLTHCVVLNEDIAEKYKINLGVECEFIYNPRSFTSTEKSSLLKKQFVACGNFVEAKGFDLLIESFSKFAKVNKEWNLVIAGDGQCRRQLEKMILDYKLENRVFLPGYMKDVKPLLLESSVYLLSSRWEGFPMCVTEAFEIGLPIVCYDIPAVLPLTRNNEGIVVEAYDVDKFAAAMLELSENTAKRKNMAKNAKKMAESISVENIIKLWENLFTGNLLRGE